MDKNLNWAWHGTAILQNLSNDVVKKMEQAKTCLSFISQEKTSPKPAYEKLTFSWECDYPQQFISQQDCALHGCNSFWSSTESSRAKGTVLLALQCKYLCCPWIQATRISSRLPLLKPNIHTFILSHLERENVLTVVQIGRVFRKDMEFCFCGITKWIASS